MPTIPQAFAVALAHHQAGRLQAAEQLYRWILQAEPHHSEAIHLLGVMAHQVGRPELAIHYLERAIALDGNVAAYHYNLANARSAMGQLPMAVESYRSALALDPSFADAHNNLGNALKAQRELEDAVDCFHRALEINPKFVEAHNNLSVVLLELGRPVEAEASGRRALELAPNFAEAHSNLGDALRSQGRLEDAVGSYRRAVVLKPNFADAHNNLGNVLAEQRKVADAITCFRLALEHQPGFASAHHNLANAFLAEGRLEQAAASYQQALSLQPDRPDAHNNLGNVLKELGQVEQAIACYRRALELQPGFADAYNNLGASLKDQGKLEEAIAAYCRAAELKPESATTHSNLLFSQLLCPDHDAKTLYEAHLDWQRRHAAALEKLIPPHPNDPSSDRRLRIGYVSPDFRNHVVGRNLLPLLREHDHGRFEIFCYSDVARPDELTRLFRGYSDVWRETAGMPHQKLAQQIWNDRIDILVDLAVHSAHNRLLVFARQPAPVQATFAGYPGTTGLSTVAYRLTDPHLDPPGLFDGCYTEESIRLPDSFWCYEPLEIEVPVAPLPASRTGYITFGCLNGFGKVNPPILKIWARILATVERSRLLLLAPEGRHREDTLRLLEAEGVERHRVAFVAPQPHREYLRVYDGIDIELDPVPYNGHTTSLDSLWMGVPVVTLVGATVVGRAGLSQLMNLGLLELIAFTPEQYVQIAMELAQDLPRLIHLRATLRARMEKSPLMDAPRFARNVEAAYREMWRRWRPK